MRGASRDRRRRPSIRPSDPYLHPSVRSSVVRPRAVALGFVGVRFPRATAKGSACVSSLRGGLNGSCRRSCRHGCRHNGFFLCFRPFNLRKIRLKILPFLCFTSQELVLILPNGSDGTFMRSGPLSRLSWPMALTALLCGTKHHFFNDLGCLYVFRLRPAVRQSYAELRPKCSNKSASPNYVRTSAS